NPVNPVSWKRAVVSGRFKKTGPQQEPAAGKGELLPCFPAVRHGEDIRDAQLEARQQRRAIDLSLPNHLLLRAAAEDREDALEAVEHPVFQHADLDVFAALVLVVAAAVTLAARDELDGDGRQVAARVRLSSQP